MKSWSVDMQNSMAQQVSTMCLCAELFLENSTELRFTNSSSDITIRYTSPDWVDSTIVADDENSHFQLTRDYSFNVRNILNPVHGSTRVKIQGTTEIFEDRPWDPPSFHVDYDTGIVHFLGWNALPGGTAKFMVSVDDVFSSSKAIMPTDMNVQGNLAVTSVEFTTFIGDDVSLDKIRRGDFNDGRMSAFWVDWTNPNLGKAYIFSDWLVGDIKVRDNKVTIEIRSKTSLLQTQIVELYSKTCRAMLGDSRCQVVLSGFQVTGTVTSVGTNKRKTFTDTSRTETLDIYSGGTIEWTSGNNNGFIEQVASYDHDTKTFTLFRPMPHDIVTSNSYKATRSCDKTLDTCVGVFDNAINFRGEPWVPQGDSITFKYGPPAIRKARRGIPWDR